MDWKWFGRKPSWPNRSTTATFAWMDWGIPRKILSQNNQCPVRDSYRVTPEYKLPLYQTVPSYLWFYSWSGYYKWLLEIRNKYQLAIPVRGHGDPYGCETLRFTHFLQSAHRWRCGFQSYAPTALYRQEDSWYSFLLEAEWTPGMHGLCQLKNTMASLGFEPATFRLVV
jgi:hypothetical protein